MLPNEQTIFESGLFWFFHVHIKCLHNLLLCPYFIICARLSLLLPCGE